MGQEHPSNQLHLLWAAVPGVLLQQHRRHCVHGELPLSEQATVQTSNRLLAFVGTCWLKALCSVAEMPDLLLTLFASGKLCVCNSTYV